MKSLFKVQASSRLIVSYILTDKIILSNRITMLISFVVKLKHSLVLTVLYFTESFEISSSRHSL